MFGPLVALLSLQSLADSPSVAAPPFESRVLWVTPTPLDGAFGHTITPMGDLNGGGTIDLMVGAPVWCDHGKQPGSVAFLCARTGRVFDTYQRPTERSSRGGCEMFPVRATALGDLDGDGLSDAALSVCNESLLPTRIELTSGRSRSVVSTLELDSKFVLHDSIVALGDTDCDGIGEWCAIDGAGRLVRFAGLSGDVVLRGPERRPSSARPRLRYTPRMLESIDDVDCDGVRDLIVGGPDAVAPNAWFCIYSGRDFSHLWSLRGSEDLGRAYAEHAMVRSGEVFVSTRCGRALSFHALSLDSARGRCIATLDLPADAAPMWRVVDDLDGDGVGEIVMAQPGKTPARLHILSGVKGVPLGPAIPLPQFSEGDVTRMGYSMADIGDVDGDGRSEIALQLCAGPENTVEEDFALCVLKFSPRSRR
jgi:hypothetical protein